MGEEAVKTKKGERTRAQILETALALFHSRGYEETTMRAIAEAAGVALGNTYYYFRSKEHLIQAFYGRTHEEHLEASAAVLAEERSFAGRLAGAMRLKIDTIMPYHRFAGILFRTAADPGSPLNPWSPESQPVRREATELFRQIVEGSDLKLKGELQEDLPELLWTYHMGVILFWIHDRSPGCRRTYRLVERTVPLLARLVGLARLPPFRPVVHAVLAMMRELKSGESD
jgi:AcrR family transcriptional regulator